jgi:heptosyltransferase-3
MEPSLISRDNPRFLVICVARFGDTLLITPTLAALKARFPKAHLTVLAHPGRVEVLRHLDCIDHLAGITKRRARWLGWWPARPFDAALVYGEEAILARFARRVARQVIGFAGRSNADYGSALTVAVARPAEPMVAVAERALLLEPLGISPRGLHLHYEVDASEQSAAIDFIQQQGWNGRRLVGFQLQSFPTKAYRDWPVTHFAELAKLLLVRYTDIQVVLLGGPESRVLADDLAQALGERVSSLAGRFSMRQNAALIARLALYVGVDTGPTHLAGALDVPMVAMYHCFHPGRFLAPQSHPALTVVEHPAEQVSRDASMAEIPVDGIYSAACAYLDKK